MFYFTLFAAIMEPTCEPRCGQNAHCRYGIISNECVCHPGTVGNPYEICGAQAKNTCAQTQCGIGAECRQIDGRVECICPIGFTGNAFISCHDIDECLENPCGTNAICINTPGSYTCRCAPGNLGNPFAMCTPSLTKYCDDPLHCACGPTSPCPSGYNCEAGKCRNLCDGITCGPRAACAQGKCVCPMGYIGNPNDRTAGCHLRGQCQIDSDCKSSEICFQFGRGVRNCVDACSKFQCGPNALCVSSDHRSNCICQKGYTGNPNDFSLGCQPEEGLRQPEICHTNSDCRTGQICIVGANGIRDCINPCASVACGTNEACQLDANSNPVCHCKDTFIWNPLTSVCEKPSIPDCTSDADCHQIATCQPDALGILKCTSICDKFQCPLNSVCVAANHHG